GLVVRNGIVELELFVRIGSGGRGNLFVFERAERGCSWSGAFTARNKFFAPVETLIQCVELIAQRSVRLVHVGFGMDGGSERFYRAAQFVNAVGERRVELVNEVEVSLLNLRGIEPARITRRSDAQARDEPRELLICAF